MGRIIKSLVAIVAGAAVILVPAGSLSRSYGAILQPTSPSDYGIVLIKNYVPQPSQQDKKEPIQTAYRNLVGAFGRPDAQLEKLLRNYLT